MRRSGFLFASLLLASLSPAGTNVTLPRNPSVSPDGSRMVFTWRGDLWMAPTAGGDARRITAHPSDDLFSAFSHDGKQLAFTSNRNGYANFYVMNTDGTGLRQVLNTDRLVGLWSFTTDGGKPAITFSSRLFNEEFPAARAYSIGLEGGEPTRLFDAYGSTPSISPDGSKILFTRGGSGWTRRGYRGPDARDVWLYDRAAKTYTQLTRWNGNDGRAKWIDDKSFVFSSDRRDNCVNLYRMSIGQSEDQAQRLTKASTADIDEFDISADGKTLVFASWDRLYRLDPAGGADAVAIDINADEDTSDRMMLKTVDRAVTAAAISPDGQSIAVIAYGQVYVRPTGSKGTARRITQPAARHGDLAWSADGQTLYFAGDESETEAIYAATVKLTRGDVKKQFDKSPATAPATEPSAKSEAKENDAEKSDDESANGKEKEPKKKKADSRWADAITFDVKTLVTDELPTSMPSPSPDGKSLAFRRGMGQLWVMDLESSAKRMLADGFSDALQWRWSPDSRNIAYVTEDLNNNQDVWIVPADASAAAVNISRHPDGDDSPRWSADGKVLAFLSTRVNNEADVYSVFLDKSLENLVAADLEKYYEEAGAAAKKREPLKAKKSSSQPATQTATKPAEPLILDLEDAYLRLKRMTTLPGDERELELSPAGDRFVFTGAVAGAPAGGGGGGGGPNPGAGRATYTIDKDGGEPKRIGPNTNVQAFNLAGDKLVVVESSRAATMKMPTGELEYLDVADKLPIDLAAQSQQKLLEAARVLGLSYYDPKLNGLDWPALTKRYLDLVRGATTPDEFEYVGDKFVGELNGSHLGVTAPRTSIEIQQPLGRLGIERNRVAGGYEVTEVYPQGPAGKGPMKLVAGDVIESIDGRSFGESDTLESLLQGRVGKEVLVTVRRKADGDEKELNLLITPISAEAETAVFYNHWRNRTAAKVAEMSGGKLGYIHIRGMDQGSLDIFERDLYAAAEGKKGLIIDVRNNGGGWTADRLLASIMFPRHAYTRPRGVGDDVKDAYPNDRLFIARYDLPINMLCNEKSFSNAEIVGHAFKTLKRGTLVGQQTAGGVISTGGMTLIDGTAVRLPGRGWWTPDGTNMELHGAMPDLLVPQTPESEGKNEDEQLRAAVGDLMKRVP